MPRRRRPSQTRRSEHWLRVAVNERRGRLNAKIASVFAWTVPEPIQWLSPVEEDGYAEYYDEAFLRRLGLPDLRTPLQDFWPAGGPRWDGLARTESGKVLLIEAKAYIEESVVYGSKASCKSLEKIRRSLSEAKKAYGAHEDASWESPFYQHANRLAHLYFLRELNGIDAYFMFLYFAAAPDVHNPCTVEQWEGAIRLTGKCLGLHARRRLDHVGHLIWDVGDMLSD